jgi:hypothetical protein
VENANVSKYFYAMTQTIKNLLQARDKYKLVGHRKKREKYEFEKLTKERKDLRPLRVLCKQAQ